MLIYILLPVYSHHDLSQNLKILRACYSAGIRRFEFTNRHENALENFAAMRLIVSTDMPDLKLGAGTIINVEDAKQFVAAGADFLISPLISQPLIDYTTQYEIEWIPGCATGTEIGMAQNAGIKLVKLYPIATLGGADFLKHIRGPFYKMKYQVSGGIKGQPAELASLFNAGADVVGLGNSFFDESLSHDDIVNKIQKLVDDLAHYI
jgi:2-dehydro-3-deoxyphosphogluconate aldolase / (4S)-4-hydroxy-2-oxoglutarate aldolase